MTDLEKRGLKRELDNLTNIIEFYTEQIESATKKIKEANEAANVVILELLKEDKTNDN